MPLRNTGQSFGAIARAFHWGMAILIVASLALIELADVAPRGSGLRRALRDWHAQAGLVVLALVWFRLAWRLGNPIPGIVPAPPAWQRAAAHAVEWTFYALMVVQPILGIVMMQADGKTVALLGFALPAFAGVDKAWAHRLEDVHEVLGNTMMILIGVHVAATLFHGKALRDNTLARMLGRNA
ncbi:MAG: cytochrome b [Burkholderiales bacterium]